MPRAEHDPPFYVLSRFRDVVEVLKQPAVWGNRDGPGVFYQEAGVLGSTDDPDHARHRRVLRAAFLPTAIARLEPRVAAIADELFDAVVPQGGGDFVELYAFPFPAIVIGELLGVRPEDRERLPPLEHRRRRRPHRRRPWRLRGRQAGHLRLHRGRGREAGSAAAPDGIPSERCDDVSSLLAIGVHDGVISRAEMRHLGYQLLVAGHETTTSLIGLMLYRLVVTPRRDGRDSAPTRRSCRMPSRRRCGSTPRSKGCSGRTPRRARSPVRRSRRGRRCSSSSARPTGILNSGRSPTSSALDRDVNDAAPARRVRLGDPLLHRRSAGAPGGAADVRAASSPGWTTSSWRECRVATSRSCSVV